MADPKFTTPVLVVSMENATARRAAFTERARATGLPWRFFDGKRTLADGLVLAADAVERNKGRQLTQGEIGCYSSHFSIWQDMIANGTRQSIVLEDDTIVDWAFLARLAETNLTAEGIPYLRLYAKTPTWQKKIRKDFLQHSRTVVELVGNAYGTQAYVITLEGARAFSQACRVVRRPIDDEMDRSWDHGVRNLMLFPAPVIEEFVESGIGSTRFATGRSVAHGTRRQKLARWVERQRIRMKKLGLALER
ncbi:glycosyltransferase family 25 protein [Sphingobium sp. BYY-5]|uniref:glycosyltransferase family 25 protein n=1 Tax=Sphingobium sp. BYY-5 TaxID=2926400 RepID=UPI001FA70173|nr:glycosyltransferase family 25 protein [Sphingobium sp. BYY-5]MCI4592662.1 glycosyltransferase family 25 protein [Sphingobium sp. BYY-5]